MTEPAYRWPVRNARSLLVSHGLRAKKSWGQNFLVDERVQQRIVDAAQLTAEETAVEIGPGLGALTTRIGGTGARVIAVERDPDMVGVLRQEFAGAPRFEVVAGDALEFDFGQAAHGAGRPLVVLGNLPYQITSPLLFHIMEDADQGRAVARIIVMVQREFAERVKAGPGSKIYGRLSVMLQQQMEVTLLFHVGSHAFHPRPSITSSVLRLVPRPAPWAPVRNDDLFAAVVKAAFGTRRKMLRRALEAVPVVAAHPLALEKAFAVADIAGTRRAEELSVAEFARLTDAVEEACA